MTCRRCESEKNLVYQDGIVKIYLSDQPVTLGHTILATAEPVATIEDMTEFEYLKVQSAIYHWTQLLKYTFCVDDVFILFMNHHKPEEKHLYWHLLPVSEAEKPGFRYNYTWFGQQTAAVNARPESEHRKLTARAQKLLSQTVIM